MHGNRTAAPRGLLARLGLDRRELRAWAMYDWATSAAQTTIAVAVFPIYFTAVAGAGWPAGTPATYWALANGLSIALIAVLAPVLGTIADYAAVKKPMLGAFLGVGVAASALMYLIQRGDLVLAAALFVLVNLGMQGSYVFYEALLPHVAREEEMDRVSTAAYAIGYVGGGVLLALNLAWIQKPAWFGLPAGTVPARLAFASVAVWWLVFSIPLFRHVAEPRAARLPEDAPRSGALRGALARLRATFGELRQYRQAFLLLVAYLIYSDGIGTIQRMAAAYGTELGIAQGTLIAAILIVQFVGIPFSFLFGALAARIGTKRAIFIGLAVYGAISIFGYFMRTAAHFYLLAFLVGTVQGGTQALSRSLFASVIPRQKSGEFFGFFSVFSRFSGIFGSLLFAAVIGRTGSMRGAILSVIFFFVAGAALLARVDVPEGQRRAREEEARYAPEPARHA